jgi:predicted RNA-binding protein with RPS1 domain
MLVYDHPQNALESNGRKSLRPDRYYGQLSRRYVAAIRAATAEGTLYDMDMRPRPSGNAGPIVTSLASFVEHFEAGVPAWQHQALTRARDSVSDNAPRITTFSIPKDRIREVIGPGGKVIREICETTGTKIDIEDDGTIKVAAVEGEAATAAINMIRDIVAEPEVGVIYDGKVVKIVDFGAFVNFIGKRDGLVHISEIAPRRIKSVSDVLSEGDNVKVKVLGIDDRGKVKLSMRAVNQESGEDLSAAEETAQAG